MANIKFGTDGWRAIVGKDFNEQNVEIVTNAIGKYVFDTFGLGKKILIGYDPRNMALEFAQKSAKLLSDVGFNVVLSSEVVPTPVIAYGARLYNACVIMFTASHNPPEYLGMKFIPDYAGPATSKITDSIVANLGKKAATEGKPKGKIEKFSFKEPYFNHLKEIVNFEAIKNLKEKIVYDGLYSASIGYFDGVLDKYGIEYEALHMVHDPNFGGGMPEPKEKYLKEMIARVKEGKGNFVGVSNDGDGDRFALINENGELVSPNEIIAILLLYLKNNKKLNGPLVKTVSGSRLLDKLAQILKIDVIETAVGFKNVGEEMRRSGAIIGGEESGGLSIQGHIPEKDGILADLLVLEAMSVKDKTLIELQKELYEVAGMPFVNDRVDLHLKNQDQVRSWLEKAKNTEKIGGFTIVRKDFKDGVKLLLSDDASWILVRPSGTEPLIRIYFESSSNERIKQLKEDFIKSD